MGRKAGSFNAYLEYAQRGRTGTPETTKESAGSLTVLRVLAAAGDAVPLTKLADQVRMTASAFQNSLKKLKESDFIKIEGTPLEEVVNITPKGREVQDRHKENPGWQNVPVPHSESHPARNRRKCLRPAVSPVMPPAARLALMALTVVVQTSLVAASVRPRLGEPRTTANKA